MNDLQLQQYTRQKARKAVGSHRLDSVLGFMARKAGTATADTDRINPAPTPLSFMLVTFPDLP